jgi:hypothetical protein
MYVGYTGMRYKEPEEETANPRPMRNDSPTITDVTDFDFDLEIVGKARWSCLDASSRSDASNDAT